MILLILAFTNPDRDTHKQAVKEEVGKVIDKATNISDDFIFADGLRSFAKMISNNMIDVAFDQLSSTTTTSSSRKAPSASMAKVTT